MRSKYCTAFIMFLGFSAFADTIDHYMNIANNIPQMEMKADPQSQTWAHSARTVINLTGESIAETLTLLNEQLAKQGKPLFCLPPSTVLTTELLNPIIQDTYKVFASEKGNASKMTVSQIALIGLQKKYPC